MDLLQKRKVYVYIRMEEKNRFVSATVEGGIPREVQKMRKVCMDSLSENSWGHVLKTER